MENIGRLLRESREQLGLTLEEVERATRIRQHHLEALERGEPGSLPSPVQARGFLRNYADFLGLDADEVLLHYSESLQGEARTEAAPPRGRAATDAVEVRKRRLPWLTSDLFIAGAIIVVVFAVLIWGGGQVLAAVRAEQSAEPEQELSLVLESSPTAGDTTPTANPAATGAGGPVVTAPAGTEGTLPPELLGEEFSGDGINLRLLVEKRAFLEVTVDGEVEFSGRVAPGEILEFQGQELIQLVTGNARGIRVVYNGDDLGVLGAVGQVVTRLWTTAGEITPTPSATPPASATPTLADTPTPAVTLTPTAPATSTPVP